MLHSNDSRKFKYRGAWHIYITAKQQCILRQDPPALNLVQMGFIKELFSLPCNKLTTATIDAAAAVRWGFIHELEFSQINVCITLHTWQSQWSPRDWCSCTQVVFRQAARVDLSSSADSRELVNLQFSRTHHEAVDNGSSDSHIRYHYVSHWQQHDTGHLSQNGIKWREQETVKQKKEN